MARSLSWGENIRRARRERGLTQVGLGRKVRLAQRQISDLERGTIDPRLSTVQDVARGLDLELMLIPRRFVPVVQGLLSGDLEQSSQPLYALEEGEDDEEDQYLKPSETSTANRRRRSS